MKGVPVTSEKLIQTIRNKLENSTRPFFLFDDDPDGLASFLILYRMIRAGKGIPLKGSMIDERMVEKVNSYFPDLIIILDKAEVSQEFINNVKAEVIWIDHHEVKDYSGTTYLNPREKNPDRNVATSHYAYRIARDGLWQAVVGIISDWQMPETDVLEEFRKAYPGYLPTDVKTPEEALFNTKVGELARIFSFNLKGKTTDVLSLMKILTRMEEPEEILERKNAQANLLMKRYEKHLKEYTNLKQKITTTQDDPLLIFTYTDDKNSYTIDLSNELLYEQPDKLIVIARQSNGSYKCSLRSNRLPVNKILNTVLDEIGGSGGGHEHACGAVIENEQFNDFVEKLREEAKKTKKE